MTRINPLGIIQNPAYRITTFFYCENYYAMSIFYSDFLQLIYSFSYFFLGIYCYSRASKIPGVLLIISGTFNGIEKLKYLIFPYFNFHSFFDKLTYIGKILLVIAVFLLIKEIIKNKKQSNTTAIDSIGKSNEKL